MTSPLIYIAGHCGMIGSAIVSLLLAKDHPASRVVTRTHAELDLTNQAAVNAFFASEKPNQLYLAEFLLNKGNTVHGIKRRASLLNTQLVDHLYQDPNIPNSRFKLDYGDLSDTSNLIRIVQETQLDEIYNLGALSNVEVSSESPEYTADVDSIAAAC